MPSTDSRRLPVRVVLGAIAVAAAASFVLPAQAAGADPIVVHQAWASTGQPPQVAAQQDAIYASALAGRERSRSYVQLALARVPRSDLQTSSVALASVFQ